MIAYISGNLVSKTPTEIVVETGGVGYSINISLQSYEQLGDIGRLIKILTYLQVKEDAHVLFGFMTESERQLFLLLISISGIGPKMALNILSGRNADELRKLVIDGNVNNLTSLPGIGRKTAERIIIELRDKLSKTTSYESIIESTIQGDIRSEAVKALIALGYARAIAEKAISNSIRQSEKEYNKVEELLKAALKAISSS